MRNAVPARREEFASGRACARTALAALGIPPVAILRDARGAPRWPGGIIGSITHCARFRAAAVAPSDEFSGLGVDAEPNEPLPEDVLAIVAVAEERLLLPDPRASGEMIHWDRLLFSAKESVYKATATCLARLDFRDVAILFDPFRPRFEARILTGLPTPMRLEGAWTKSAGTLMTALAIRHPR